MKIKNVTLKTNSNKIKQKHWEINKLTTKKKKQLKNKNKIQLHVNSKKCQLKKM